MSEQAVIAYFDYHGDDLELLLQVEDQLEVAITDVRVGEFDGNEIAVDLSDGSLYMYGPDAEALFSVVRPILESAECLSNIRVILRFGPPEDGTPERTETLAEKGLEGRAHRHCGSYNFFWLHHTDSPKTVNRCHPRSTCVRPRRRCP